MKSRKYSGLWFVILIFVLINDVFSAVSTVTPGIGFKMVPYPKELLIYAYMDSGNLVIGTPPTTTPVATTTVTVSGTNTASPTNTNSPTATPSSSPSLTATVSPSTTSGIVKIVTTQVVYSCKKTLFKDYLYGVVYQEIGLDNNYAMNKAMAIAIASRYLQEPIKSGGRPTAAIKTTKIINKSDGTVSKTIVSSTLSPAGRKRWTEVNGGTSMEGVIGFELLQAYRETEGVKFDLKEFLPAIDSILSTSAVSVISYQGGTSHTAEYFGSLNSKPRYCVAAEYNKSSYYNPICRMTKSGFPNATVDFHNEAPERADNVGNGGVGLFQNGATLMSESLSDPDDFDKILRHYYHPAPPYLAYVGLVQGKDSKGYKAAWNLDGVGGKRIKCLAENDYNLVDDQPLNIVLYFSEEMNPSSIKVMLKGKSRENGSSIQGLSIPVTRGNEGRARGETWRAPIA